MWCDVIIFGSMVWFSQTGRLGLQELHWVSLLFLQFLARELRVQLLRLLGLTTPTCRKCNSDCLGHKHDIGTSISNFRGPKLETSTRIVGVCVQVAKYILLESCHGAQQECALQSKVHNVHGIFHYRGSSQAWSLLVCEKEMCFCSGPTALLFNMKLPE